MQQRGAIYFALTRALSAVPTLFFVVVLAFLMMRAAPGGPFDHERALPAETRANIEAAYNLDEPLHHQLYRYLSGLLRGDLGPSYRYAEYDVNELIAEAAPISFRLGAAAFAIALLIGMTAGVVAGLNHNRPVDRIVTLLSLTGISIPVLIVAPLLVLVFAVELGVLPASWTGSEGAARYVLPVIALALPQVAYIMRLMRASLIEVMKSDFIRTARAQGLGVLAIVRRHALKPALLPLLSYMGPAVASLLAGSVIVEQVFGIPGLGNRFVTGAENRDYTLVLGIVILYATLVISLNLIVDVLYGFLDPRIRRR